MRKIWNKMNRATVSSTSVTPSSEASSDPTARPAPPKHNDLQRRLLTEIQTPLPTNYITTKHSNAFNSEKATGLNKLEQLQLVERLKQIVIDEAAIVHRPFNKHTTFKVITARKYNECPANPAAFDDDVIHVAKLVAVKHNKTESEWTLIGEGDAKEYLADAMENPWGKVVTKAGEVIEGVQVGDRFPGDRGKVAARLRRKSGELYCETRGENGLRESTLRTNESRYAG